MARTRIRSSSRRRRRLGSQRMETSRSSASSTGRKKLSLRKKRSRMDLNKAKKYLIGGATAAFVLLVAVLLIVLRPGTYIIETGNISFSVNSTGVMIRNETLYSAEGYRKTEFLAEEGQNLSQGSPIADVYSSDYSEKDYQDLKELQEKILDYQQSNAQTGIIDEDMKALDEQIRNKTEQIRKVITREAQGNLQNLQREIAQLMDERANIMRNASIEDTQLSEFYAQEKELLNRIQNYKKTIVAEKNGIVSFYFDGTENILTPGNLDKLTVKSINDIVNGKFTDTMDDGLTLNKNSLDVTAPDGYAKTSLIDKAKNLKGRLQIITGYNDATVVPQHCLSFLDACVKAGTQPDFFAYPGEEHNMRGHASVHLHERITRYFEDYLK